MQQRKADWLEMYWDICRGGGSLKDFIPNALSGHEEIRAKDAH